MNNFVVRTLAGAAFLCVMVAGLLFHPAAFGALFLIVLYMCMREFLSMTMGGGWSIQQKIGILTAAAFYVLTVCHCFFGLDGKWIAAAILPFSCLPVSMLFAKSRDRIEDTAFVYLALLYICFPFCLSPVLVRHGGEFCGYILLNVFILIWSADIGSYVFGTLFGQKSTSRKLAPSISPKKSWWGFWGGIAVSLAVSYLLHALGWMPYGILHCLALGLLVPVAGVCGDLFESLWKRRYGLKDSGNCIPGHGGMLDRFDSTLFVIPAVFVYLLLFGLL